MNFGQRVRVIRQHRKLTQEELATLAGIDQRNIAAIESRDSKRSDHAPAIARALHVDLHALLTGEGLNLEEPEAIPKPMTKVSSDDADDPLSASSENHVIVGNRSGAQVYVGRIRGAHLKAGTGEIIYDMEEVPDSRAYDAEWFRQAGLRAKDCKVWPVRGDSMYPTIPHGAHVLLDLRSRQPKHDRVFALIGDDGLRLKRLLKRSDGVWEIHSDNPLKTSYPTELYVPGKVAIFGQVRDISIPMPA